MMEILERLIRALREELQQYGEMLARLDDQQNLVMRRSADGVLHTVPLVQDQSAVLMRARECRQAVKQELCMVLGLDFEGGADHVGKPTFTKYAG